MQASPLVEARHFARAVTQLGDKRPVVARSAIYNAQGLKVIDKGVTVDARLYERLARHRLKTPLAECLDVDPTVLASGLRDELRALAAHDRFCAAVLDDLRDPEALLEELTQIPLPRAIGFQLTVMQETQPALWQHSLRSALVAAWLGARSGGSRYDQRMLAAGGMLHDLGMLHLDPVLLQPEVDLAGAQRRQLDTHALVSVMLLETHHEYPKELLRAVLEHHEALDGSGYPRGLAGAEIGSWGRALALTELVTAMTAPGHEAPATRLSLALRMNAPRYDPEMTREVMRLLQSLRETLPPAEPGAGALRDLEQITQLLLGWPEAVARCTALGPAQRAAAERISALCDAEHKALLASGATPAQWAALGDDADELAHSGEFVLIAREACWQLRAVAREAARRWRLGSGQSFPTPVQAWLDAVDALCVRKLGRAPARPDAEARAA